MKLTEQQFFDYMYCPAKFHMKYVGGIDLPEQPTMNTLLNKISKFFYVNLLDKKICSVNELKTKWDSICKSHPTYFENGKKVLEGMGLIINMVNWASREQIVILDIDTRYHIMIDGVELEGNMNPLLAAPGNKTQLLISDFSQKNPDQIQLDMQMKYTIDCMGYKRMYNKDLNGVRVHNMKANTDMFTIRDTDDYNRLLTAIKGVANGIEHEAFYPREQVLCTSCNARDYCKYWHK